MNYLYDDNSTILIKYISKYSFTIISTQVVKMLINYGINVNTTDRYGDSALICATKLQHIRYQQNCKNNREDIVNMFFDATFS